MTKLSIMNVETKQGPVAPVLCRQVRWRDAMNGSNATDKTTEYSVHQELDQNECENNEQGVWFNIFHE
jgi:hypothetical protein